MKTQLVGNNFIIQWTNVPHYSNVGAATFQVQLDMSTGEIRFIYQDVDFGSSSYNGGASATVGIQFSSSEAQQVSYNTNSLSAGQCISFTPQGSSFTYDWSANSLYLDNVNSSTPNATGVLSAQTYIVTVTDANSGCIKTESVSLATYPAPTPVAFNDGPKSCSVQRRTEV